MILVNCRNRHFYGFSAKKGMLDRGSLGCLYNQQKSSPMYATDNDPDHFLDMFANLPCGQRIHHGKNQFHYLGN